MAYHVVIDESAEGKRVVDRDGEEVGTVTAVRDGTAYVDPDRGAFEKLAGRMGWEDVGRDAYPLPEASIERITNEEVHVREEF
jgi:hypothetical protein